MTDEYIKDLMQDKIPVDIYGEGTEVKVNIDRFRINTFNRRIGCSIDGINQDLGAVNGQEPIKEANKLFYWMITTIFHSYHQMRLTLVDLKKVLRPLTDGIDDEEQVRKKAFMHLLEKQYHKIQQTLCEERLKQRKPLPPELRMQLQKEALDHKQKHAALVIFGFWKKHRIKHNEKHADQEVGWAKRSVPTKA